MMGSRLVKRKSRFKFSAELSLLHSILAEPQFLRNDLDELLFENRFPRFVRASDKEF